MSNSSTPIFVPSRSASPANSTGNTPYVITSPPPESPTNSEMAFPYEQMIKHIACLLNVKEEEIRCQFPFNHSLLPINISPSCHHIPIPDTLPSYPGAELANYIDPSFPILQALNLAFTQDLVGLKIGWRLILAITLSSQMAKKT